MMLLMTTVISLFLQLPFSVSLPQTTTGSDLTISTPSSAITCQAVVGLVISGGTPPYVLSIYPDGDPSETALETLTVQAQGTVDWIDDVALTAGDIISFGVVDSTGTESLSGPVQITVGGTTSCPNANAGETVLASTSTSTSTSTSSTSTTTTTTTSSSSLSTTTTSTATTTTSSSSAATFTSSSSTSSRTSTTSTVSTLPSQSKAASAFSGAQQLSTPFNLYQSLAVALSLSFFGWYWF